MGLKLSRQLLRASCDRYLLMQGLMDLKNYGAKASPDGFGIDIDSGDPVDMWKMGVLDPLLVKTMALRSAGEIAKSVLRIDRNLGSRGSEPTGFVGDKEVIITSNVNSTLC